MRKRDRCAFTAFRCDTDPVVQQHHKYVNDPNRLVGSHATLIADGHRLASQTYGYDDFSLVRDYESYARNHNIYHTAKHAKRHIDAYHSKPKSQPQSDIPPVVPSEGKTEAPKA